MGGVTYKTTDDIYGFSHLKSNSFLKNYYFPKSCFIIKGTIQNLGFLLFENVSAILVGPYYKKRPQEKNKFCMLIPTKTKF